MQRKPSSIFLFLLTVLLQVSAKVNAQEKITLSEKNASLEKVFGDIQKQTSYNIWFDKALLEKTSRVNINLKDVSLEQALIVSCTGQPLEFSIVGKSVVIKEKIPKESPDPPGKLDITGRVTNENGEPVSGVSIIVKNSKTGTQTEKDGSFTLTGIDENATLVFSGTNVETREEKINHRTYIVVVLKTRISKLDDVQIIGYGTTTRRYSTGNVSTVTSEEISKQPVANPLSALSGRMPGVYIQNGLGLPGSQVNVQIRGINSIAGSNNPLYVVDGVPFPSTPLNSWNQVLAGANGLLSPFNSINPDDIESIDVLKDADATAIYGSRASNGVVLITTKKAKAGKTKLDLQIYTGTENATHIIKTLNTQQFLTIMHEAFANDGITPTPANAPFFFVYDTTKYTDFQQLMIGNTAQVTDAQVTISGGNEHTRFLLGGNYRNEGTVFPGDLYYKRGGMHLNLEHYSNDQKFYAAYTNNIISDNNNNTANNISHYGIAPNYPLYDSVGNLYNIGGVNPLASVQQLASNKTFNLISNVLLRYTLLPGLNLKTSLGYNRIELNSLLTYPISSQDPSSNPVNKALYANNSNTTYIVEPQIDYTRNISRGKFAVLVGGTYQYSYTYGNSIQGENYSNDGLLQDLGSAGSISTFPPPATNYAEYKYVSLFSRISYNWRDKYIINLNARRDGSSRFGPGNQFGNFGSAGAAWIFSNENWMKDHLSTISFGKFRMSYGTVGNDPNTDYQYLSTYQPFVRYQNISGLIPSRIANPDYKWEITKKFEAAIELGLLKDRILLSVSWFKNRSNNQLVGYPLPSQTGFTSYQYNLPAIVENSGTEIEFSTVNIRNGKFSWTSSLNISFIDNKLVSFPGLASSSYANTYVVGQSVTIVKGYHFTGIDPANGTPMYLNSKGQETAQPSSLTDYIVFGKKMPDFYGGFNNTFRYGNFKLSFLFQFAKQKNLSNTWYPGVQNTLPTDALQRWQAPGDITSIPKPTTRFFNTFSYSNSDRYWSDASYIRLKNLEFSYTLPAGSLSSLHISDLTIFLQGQNLLTITDYKGSDPEIPGTILTVPTLRTVAIGLHLTF